MTGRCAGHLESRVNEQQRDLKGRAISALWEGARSALMIELHRISVRPILPTHLPARSAETHPLTEATYRPLAEPDGRLQSIRMCGRFLAGASQQRFDPSVQDAPTGATLLKRLKRTPGPSYASTRMVPNSGKPQIIAVGACFLFAHEGRTMVSERY